MKNTPVIALLVAYGPEVRAFVQSGLAQRLASRCRVMLATSQPSSPALAAWDGPIELMPDAAESSGMRRVRRVSARLRRMSSRRIAAGAARAERFVSRAAGGSSEWTAFLHRHSISAVVAASYSSARTLPALQSAHNLRLPTVTLLNSFKDVYKRSYAPSPPSAIAVSGEREVRWFRRHNPGYDGVLSIGGSLHLSAVWARRGETSRSEFCRGLGLDPARPIVTYCASCASAGESSVEELNWVRRFAREIPTWRGRPQMLVRGNPMDEAGRWNGLPATVWVPDWESDRAGDWCCPTAGDAAHWAAALEQSVLCISGPSTVTTEFVAFGKPVVNLCGPAAWRRLWEDEVYREIRERGWATPAFDIAEVRSLADRALARDVTPPAAVFASSDPVKAAVDLIEEVLHMPYLRRDPIPQTA